ncbi:MAG: alkaline phosphatase D family protein, partial [Chloroflexi bacterium]|nr:alkaline phosphatase D family protein [Chloroflexota bacterium]
MSARRCRRPTRQAYWEHQGMHAPPFQIPLRVDHGTQYGLHRDDPGSLAYTFEFGAAAFFVMDTRTMRIKNRQEQMMLGEGQWQALEDWLLAVKDAYPLKFLVTSCAVLFSMWADIPRDRWSGFPKERDRLLHFLAANGIEGVYFLTGDLHSAHAISADLYGPNRQPLRIWEFCSTPFECAAPTRQE